ncbi:uroporphyrinogen-III synthase [Acinetobacter lanii]|uniref:Uroporphyrinogen-III synthase n=1 Tax=Acinetobacter lanii TaxID=2715163 RepID=A0A6G8S7C6_9GAMM|nr:uroporphyrinogen-III synthase [Acinetobacter lanii]QIO10057.1 uroporphyrinogen-III synthase [Acinetobacter lanii]
MLFINTRPPERAQALTQCLLQANYAVIDLPVLALRDKALDAELISLFQSLVSAQVIVVVSPKAVEVGMRYLAETGITLDQLQHIQWIAVGQTTAHALSEYGLISLIPEVESSEGMLNLPIFDQLQNLQTIAFWRGEGGRQFMMQQCQQRGIEILNVVLYERYCPISSVQQLPQLLQALNQHRPPYVVCISSEASWRNWLTLLSGHETVIAACHYWVLGERLEQLLKQDQKSLNLAFKVSCLHQLKPDVVLHKLEQLKREV